MERTGNLASFLIKESRINELIRKEEDGQNHWGEETNRLLQSLARQTPNRIYVGDDGRMARVIIFSDIIEKWPYNIYWELLQPNIEPWEWSIEKTEIFTGANPQTLDKQLSHVRAKYGLRKDLLTNPDRVKYIIGGNSLSMSNFIHAVDTSSGIVACQYHTSPMGPRFVRWEHGKSADQTEGATLTLQKVPEDILTHQNPYASQL